MTRDAVRQAVQEVEAAADSLIQPRKVTDAGLWETDLDTGKTTMDPSLERLYGLEGASFDGDYEDWLELVHPEDREAVQAAWDQTLENGEPYQIAFRIQRPDGTIRWLDSRARLITDEDGEPSKMQGLNTDITESQERIQALQVLDRVLRHNLRNDMNVIEGHAEIIQETGSEAAAEHARKIQRVAEELRETAEKQRTIGALLTTDQRTERIDLVDTIETVASRARDTYPEARITLELPATAEMTAVDTIDAAIREIIENAIVHSDRERPTVAVALEQDEAVLTLEIADNGPGISPEERNIVTGEQEITPLQHASGLGLWLISWVIERSGGSIRFEQNQPRGTVLRAVFRT